MNPRRRALWLVLAATAALSACSLAPDYHVPETPVPERYRETDEYGAWRIHGRSDDTIKVSGRRVGPAELEAALLKDPRILETAVVGVPDEILLKDGPLTQDERQLMERHAEIGCQMLSGSRNPLLQLGAEIAWCHHERWDGTGYPRGLQGSEIPESARIVSIVDVYSAMSTDRPYRQALPLEIVLRELQDGAGTQFDPQIVQLFLDRFEELVL